MKEGNERSAKTGSGGLDGGGGSENIIECGGSDGADGSRSYGRDGGPGGDGHSCGKCGLARRVGKPSRMLRTRLASLAESLAFFLLSFGTYRWMCG